MRFFRCVLPFLTLAAVVGCGTTGDSSQIAVYPVKGRLLLADGQPVRGANIVLVGAGTAGGANGIGALDKDGNFAIKTMGDRDGMMPGKYKVVVNPQNKVPGASTEDQAFGMKNIPRKYWDDGTTDLVVEVNTSDNVFNLTLK